MVISESIVYVQIMNTSIYFQRAVVVEVAVLLVDALDLRDVGLMGRFN